MHVGSTVVIPLVTPKPGGGGGLGVVGSGDASECVPGFRFTHCNISRRSAVLACVCVCVQCALCTVQCVGVAIRNGSGFRIRGFPCACFAFRIQSGLHVAIRIHPVSSSIFWVCSSCCSDAPDIVPLMAFRLCGCALRGQLPCRMCSILLMGLIF